MKFIQRITSPMIALGMSASLLCGLIGGCSDRDKAEREHPAAQAKTQVQSEDGQTTVTLATGVQQHSGIAVERLPPTQHRAELQATAVVLPVQALATLYNDYVAAKAQVAKSGASVEVSEREYERLQGLYKQDQTASVKAVQAAGGTLRSDQSSVTAAESALTLNYRLANQNWGGIIAKWFTDDSPQLGQILSQQAALLQVSLPLGAKATPPAAARVQPSSGAQSIARFVSRFPQVDPRLQTPTYLYRSPSQSGLTPGMTVSVLLPQGKPLKGVVIPNNAVVWSKGLAWAYVETSPGQFARRAVATDTPVQGGWFVVKGFSPGDRIVVRGAQQLLAIESAPPAQAPKVGEEGDEGDD